MEATIYEDEIRGTKNDVVLSAWSDGKIRVATLDQQRPVEFTTTELTVEQTEMLARSLSEAAFQARYGKLAAAIDEILEVV